MGSLLASLPSLFACLSLAAGATAADPEPRVFRVADFGARPDADTDAGPGIRSAVAAAMGSGGPAVVRFAAGSYRVAPLPGTDDAIVVAGAANLTLEGAGAMTRFVVTDPSVGAIRFQECRDVRIAALTIDYDPLPFTQGTVLSADPQGGQFEFVCDPGYQAPEAPCFARAHGCSAMVVQLPGGGPEQYGPIFAYVASWTAQADGSWRASVDDAASVSSAGIRPGARLVYMGRRHVGAAVTAWASHGVVLEDVTVHAGPSCATMWGINEDLVVRRLRVERVPGSERLLSTNADGIHCLGNRGGLLIEGCSFGGMADDAINIHARAAAPVEQLAPNRLRVNPLGAVEFRVGDRVQIYDPEHGRVRYAGVTIAAVEEQAPFVVLDFVEPLQGVVIGSSFRDADHLFNLDACGGGAVIRGNHFGIHRGRGVLLKSVNGVIEHNTFHNREGWGVTLHQLQGWGEGPAAQGVLIRANTFEGARPGWSPFIDIRPTRRGDRPTEGRPVCNVRIEGNRMTNPANGAVYASGIEGLEIVGNTIDCAPDTREVTGPLLRFRNVARVRVDALTVQDQNDRTTALVEIAEDIPPDEVRIPDAGTHAELRPGVPLVSRGEAP